jgi:type IV pilus assembly protein PilA
MMKLMRSKKGFTLVELMIVVAIIGILAAIAIPNFLNFRLKAKTSEAKSNLGAIRSTEVAYFAEWGDYIVGQTYTPGHTGAAPFNQGDKVRWDPTTRFSILGFAPEGMVFYDYQLEDTAVEINDTTFTARAHGDLDNDSQWSEFFINEQSTEILKTGAPF